MSHRSPRRGRSRRSHAIELALACFAIAAILLFLTLGGPQLVGPVIAELFMR